MEDGRLAGQVELVDTGEQAIVHSAEELLAYLRAHCPGLLSSPPLSDEQPDRV
ncbi:MAG: hypothetical protein ACYCXW_15470 [Solirubrobacteraceae bacterium]